MQTAPGWTQVTGGHHFCSQHRELVAASPKAPVWIHYSTGTTSDMVVCGPCAKEAGDDR